MKSDAAALVDRFLNTYVKLSASHPTLTKGAVYVYTPDPRLRLVIDRVNKLSSAKVVDKTKVGRALEQVAYLLFKGIRGADSIESFQSQGPQYDLLVRGDSLHWLVVTKMLYMDSPKSVLVEAKATEKALGDAQFARACALLDHNLFQTAGVGVFLTLHGAGGFPAPGDPPQRLLRDCRLRQFLFHARKLKPIVVFDEHDLTSLARGGNFVGMLRQKIADVEEGVGLSTSSRCGRPRKVRLPSHLSSLARRRRATVK